MIASFKFSIKDPLSNTHSIADRDDSFESSAIVYIYLVSICLYITMGISRYYHFRE